MGDVLTYEQKVITVRRISAALGAFALLVSLAACGDSDAAGGLDAVSVSGEFGAEPVVTWNGQVTTDKLAVTTLIEGTGDTLAKGDTAKVNLWIGNGYTKELAYSTWEKDKTTGKVPGVQIVQLTDSIPKGILEAVVDHTIGSRVLSVAPPADAFGDQGQPSLGIGDGDDVVFIIDIVGGAGPHGTTQTPPAWAPRLVENDDTPTGFDFSQSPKNPPSRLQKIALVKGDGATVESGQTVTVNYLGSVYGSTEVFDQSYDGTPYPVTIGKSQVIKGWDQSIVGATVGSRLLLVIPADLAYGDQGSGDKIKPGDTLVFVVDILSAS